MIKTMVGYSQSTIQQGKTCNLIFTRMESTITTPRTVMSPQSKIYAVMKQDTVNVNSRVPSWQGNYMSKSGIPQKYFNKLIKSKLIMKLPVTLEDAIRSEKIQGPNISSLKVNTIHPNSGPVVTDFLTVLREIIKANKNITRSEDILFFNKVPFFAAFTRNLKFTTIKCISNRTLNQITHSMVTVKSVYINRGFGINNALMDI